MKCAYCGKEAVMTKEHIVSHSVLELFPECDLTFDMNRKTQYKSEPMVKDVCSDCNNNRITYIDSYAKEFIEKYFMEDYEADCKVHIQYTYIKLLKVLLKYSFNDARAHKVNVEYFDDGIKNFLLNETNEEIPKPISVYGGINVNTSAYPSFLFGNQKLQWVQKPIFMENSIIRYYDEFTGRVYPREDMKQWQPEGLVMSYMFRFNSGQFLVLCWDNMQQKEKMDMLIPLSYPYKLLEPDKEEIVLERCTHAYNCHHPELIDVTWGLSMADMTNSLIRTDVNPIDMQRLFNQDWLEHEKKIREQHAKYVESKKKKS